MKNSSSSRHSLYLTWLNQPMVSKTVLVLKGAIYDICYNLHVFVLMKIKSCSRFDDIIIEDAQRSKADFTWIEIFSKGKVVVRFKPFTFSLVMLVFFCDFYHDIQYLKSYLTCRKLDYLILNKIVYDMPVLLQPSN